MRIYVAINKAQSLNRSILNFNEGREWREKTMEGLYMFGVALKVSLFIHRIIPSASCYIHEIVV